MHKAPFIIKELSIKKMPGFPGGMEAYRDLAPGINIIAGPNASGKSSTARVIRNLIWKGEEDGLVAEGSVLVDGNNWEIKLDSGRRTVQRDGVDDELAGLPASEASGRYMLALHDLVVANESDLAKQILKEAIGGYDLDEAQKNLDYSGSIKNKLSAEYRNFYEADSKCKELIRVQQELKQQEEQLQDLYLRKEKADVAATHLEFYLTVKEYLEAKRRHDDSSEILDKFPPILEEVTGEEYKTICELERERTELKNKVDEAFVIIERNRNKLSALNLPAEGIEKSLIKELEKRVELLERIDREIKDAEKKIAELKIGASESLKCIDENAETAGWQGIKLDDVVQLDMFLQKLHKEMSGKQFFETRYRELTELIGGKDISDEANILAGIKTLSCWLQEERSKNLAGRIWIPVLTIAGMVSGFLMWLYGIPGIFVIVIAGLAAWFSKPAAENNLRRKDYEKTGLKHPVSWDIPGVAETVESLVAELALTERIKEISREAEYCRKQIFGSEKKLEQLRETENRLRDRIKAVPGINEEDLMSYDGMYWFLSNVAVWQRCNTDVLRLFAVKDELHLQYRENLEVFNSLLKAINVNGAGDVVEAVIITEKIKEELTIWKDCNTGIENQTEVINTAGKQVEKIDLKLKDLFDKCKVEYGRKELVKELVEKLQEYRLAKQSLVTAGSHLSEKGKLVRYHSLYESNKGKIKMLLPDEVESSISAFADEAGKINDLNQTITRIETKINFAWKGNDLEQALNRKDKALSDLESLFEKNLSSLTGQILVDNLKASTREKNHSKVFSRANDHLKNITRGRYELRLDDTEKPAFRAFDTVSRLGQELSELSTGTRIQLLMCVRLAFIETQETILRLPLLADELLANSDDSRAYAIIDALIRISRNGRQVFYFTAQSDEVARWKLSLENSEDVSSRIVELTGMNNDSINGYNKMAAGTVNLLNRVPPPAGMNNYQYREILSVVPYDLLSDEPGQLHLWYLIEDNKLLYNCLKSGVKYWGQLQSFLSVGKIEGLTREIFNCLELKVKLLERYLELYRRGRSRPVDMDSVKASGAVSDVHYEAVALKLAEVDNDPSMLIAALKNGEVPRFLKARCADLEQFFVLHGIINEQDPLDADEIILHLNAFISMTGLSLADAGLFLKKIVS